MADNSASASHRRYPPKKRARIDSDLEESSPAKESGSGDNGEEEEDFEEEEEDFEEEEEDSSPSSSIDRDKDHYLYLLAQRNRLTNEPLISTSDRDDLLALAAARQSDTIGKYLQSTYDLADLKERHEFEIPIINNFASYEEQVINLLSSIPPDLDPSESRTQMRQLCTRVDQIFDIILQLTDLDSKVERKGNGARAMQSFLRRLLIFSAKNGYTIPEEFRSGPGDRLGLDGKMLMLIKDKFNHEKHDIKMMMVGEDSWGG
ncbi:hypothetical protein N0V85_001976 [Neurospora sp. IMI 360204]|nr:hypothetical protein N0V85_001976 [Neurospora sp. IMI 360204]